MEPKKLKLLAMQGKKSKRIDSELYLKESQSLPDNLRVLNTLYDIQLGHNAMLIAGQKNAEELAAESQSVAAVAESQHGEEIQGTRTVIANVGTSAESQNVQADLSWTLTQLRDVLIVEFNLVGEYRLKDAI